VHPQAEQESILRHFLLCGEYLELQLDRRLKATTKKVVNFLRKKCTPDKILTTPMPPWTNHITCSLLRAMILALGGRVHCTYNLLP